MWGFVVYICAHNSLIWQYIQRCVLYRQVQVSLVVLDRQGTLSADIVPAGKWQWKQVHPSVRAPYGHLYLKTGNCYTREVAQRAGGTQWRSAGRAHPSPQTDTNVRPQLTQPRRQAGGAGTMGETPSAHLQPGQVSETHGRAATHWNKGGGETEREGEKLWEKRERNREKEKAMALFKDA